MAKNTYNTEDVLRMLEEDDSDFFDSESSGEEGDEIYAYLGPSFEPVESEAECENSDSG